MLSRGYTCERVDTLFTLITIANAHSRDEWWYVIGTVPAAGQDPERHESSLVSHYGPIFPRRSSESRSKKMVFDETAGLDHFGREFHVAPETVLQ